MGGCLNASSGISQGLFLDGVREPEPKKHWELKLQWDIGKEVCLHTRDV